MKTSNESSGLFLLYHLQLTSERDGIGLESTALPRFPHALDSKQAFFCRMQQKSLFFVFFRRNPENPTIQSPKKMV